MTIFAKDLLRWVIAISFLAAAIVNVGCGAAEGPAVDTNKGDLANGQKITPGNVSRTEVNSEPEENVNTSPGRFGALANRRAERQATAVSDLPTGELNKGEMARPLSRPAPDDSIYYSTLTDVATETREFRSHPLLKKVEKISDGRTKKIKIYLKSGKVVELAGKDVPNFPRASAATFVALAGLPPVPTPTPPPAKKVFNPQKRPNG